MTNFNAWMVLAPIFLVEAVMLGYLTRHMRPGFLDNLLKGIIAAGHATILFCSLWRDSARGLIQLAEDMTVGYESPLLAIVLIAAGTGFLAIIVAVALGLIMSTSADLFAQREAKAQAANGTAEVADEAEIEEEPEPARKLIISERNFLHLIEQAYEDNKVELINSQTAIVDIRIDASGDCA